MACTPGWVAWQSASGQPRAFDGTLLVLRENWWTAVADEIDLTKDNLRRSPSLHRWWARRGEGASMAVVLLTHAPEIATDEDALQAAAENPADRTGDELEGLSLLDLCAGACTVAAAASRLGASATAVDNHPIPVLIGRGTLVYPVLYGSADRSTRGSGPSSGWAGLAQEVAHWSILLVQRTKADAGAFWLPEVDGVIGGLRLKCPSPACGRDGIASKTATPSTFIVERGHVECGDCGTRFSLREGGQGGYMPRSLVREGKVVSLGDDLRDLLENADYPPPVEPFLDEPFVFNRAGAVLVRDAITPRQAQVLRSAQTALRSIRDDLADLGYAPDRARAIVVYLALALSGLVDLLSTFARWDERRGQPVGIDRQEWVTTVEYLEVGGSRLEQLLERRLSEIQAIIAARVNDRPVDVRLGDMTDLKDPEDAFDLVVWDPPFYDNIAYDRVSLPWTRFLRSTIGDLDPTLRWPVDPSVDDRPPRFDGDEYETELRQAACEVSRVLRPGGRLGVFWITRPDQGVDDLSAFLDLVEPAGLELVQSFTLRTEVAPPAADGNRRKSLLLVFRSAPAALPSDAERVLEGERAGLPMLIAGLVALLEEHLGDDEIAELIPKGFQGPRSEQLAEAVLSQPDPRRSLDSLSRRDLKQYCLERGMAEEDLAGLDRSALAALVFSLLGWRIPSEAAFTIGQALDDIAESASQVALGGTEADIRGASTTAFARLEDILRFTVVTWATRLSGERWADRLVDIADKRPDQFALGDWFRAFSELPSRFASQDQSVGAAGARLRKAKVLPPMQEVISLRNEVAHPNGPIEWIDMRNNVVQALRRAVDVLRVADEAGGLPRVLQPFQETRDPYGRITLRLVAHPRRSVEFLMTEPSDLTSPMVVLPGDTNPREIDPARVDAATVFERAGVVHASD